MTRRICAEPGCPIIGDWTRGRCAEHERAKDKARGTATQRGYNGKGHQRFRRVVLARDPVCVLCRSAYATVADHHPIERRDLVTQGLNPDDPSRGRGLCKPCHDRHTAATHGFGRMGGG